MIIEMFQRRQISFVAFALIVFLSTGDGRRDARSLELQSVVESSNLFAEKLYKELTLPGKPFEDRNVLVSPMSLDIGLSMLMAGASGETEGEIREGLSISANTAESEINTGVKDLITSLKKKQEEEEDEGVQLANRVYVGAVFPIKPKFLHTLRENYFAEAEQVDFGYANKAAGKINNWVEKATYNKIRDIVSPSMFNNITAMVLVNTLHFKGYFKYPFSPEKTGRSKFKTFYGGETTVEMMKLDMPQRYRYARIPELKSAAVAIPYLSHRHNLIILLPDPNQNIQDVESKLGDGILANIPSRMRSTNVDIRMPKFKLQSTLDLVASKTLENLGMISLTSPTADFTKISDEPGLRITNAVQKTFLDVNEAGSEAAAATAFVAQARSLNVSPDSAIRFVVDRPFIAYIHDSKTNSILFIARKIT